MIAGYPGSGKTTVSTFIAKKFKLDYISAGKLYRELASADGVDINSLKFLKWYKQARYDKIVDSQVRKASRKGNCVIDSWLAPYLIKDGIKIFLKVDFEVAAKRVASRENISIRTAKIITRKRLDLTRRRAKRLYGIKLDDLSVYNFVIDTTFLNVNDVNNLVSFLLRRLRL